MAVAPSRVIPPIAASPAPPPPGGVLHGLRTHLFGNPLSTLTTLVLLGLLLSALPGLIDWAVLRAQWLPQAEACRAPGAGACWGVIAEKYALILLGRYPPAEKWRAVLACAVLLALLVASAPSYWDSRGHLRRQTLQQLDATAAAEAQGISAWVKTQQRILQSLKPVVALENPRAPLAAAAEAASGSPNPVTPSPVPWACRCDSTGCQAAAAPWPWPWD